MKKEEVKFLNENLYRFRKEKGISQEELGNIIGVSRQAVYKWESGERMPDINNLNSLCEYFDKSIEDFIDGADSLFKQKENEEKTTKKKYKISKIVLTIFIVIMVLYSLTVIFKALFFGTMFMKINRYKDSNNYSYEKKYNFYNIDDYIDENGKREIYDMTLIEHINYKDGKQNTFSFVETSIPINGNYKISSNDWFIFNGKNIEIYRIQENQCYYGNADKMDYSPYEIIYKYAKEFYVLKNVLNLFKTFKIDLKNKDLVFEVYNKKGIAHDEVYIKEKIYIDLENGLLSKVENYEQNELRFVYNYYDYKFDSMFDDQVNLNEELKKEIIEKYDLEKQNAIEEPSEKNIQNDEF